MISRQVDDVINVLDTIGGVLNECRLGRVERKIVLSHSAMIRSLSDERTILAPPSHPACCSHRRILLGVMHWDTSTGKQDRIIC